jgi:hypothetical protein
MLYEPLAARLSAIHSDPKGQNAALIACNRGGSGPLLSWFVVFLSLIVAEMSLFVAEMSGIIRLTYHYGVR